MTQPAGYILGQSERAARSEGGDQIVRNLFYLSRQIALTNNFAFFVDSDLTSDERELLRTPRR